MKRLTGTMIFFLLPAVLLLLAGTWQVIGQSSPAKGSVEVAAQEENVVTPPQKLFPTEINKPDGPPTVATNLSGLVGQPVMASCSSCHTTRVPNRDNRSGADLNEFHQELVFQHGNLSCLSCHNPGDYDTLRLAEGSKVEYPEVMTLCAQCHGTQYRDYQHGAHGGMIGHWDLRKGGRYRNNCIDCHDPHSPAYQGVLPAPHSNDRFFSPRESNTHDNSSIASKNQESHS